MPEGRVAVVTGAGRGIGRAAARLLSARGARVLAVSRSASDLRSLAAEVEVEVFAESVASAEGCARIIDAARELGRIEILVNNAGMGSSGGKAIWEQDPGHWHETLVTNLYGPFELTRLAARDMIEGRYGRIVMVSSTAGQVGGPRMSAYCASKHGLNGLMKAVAQDVGPYGITCNAVQPGWVHTDMADRSAAREAELRDLTVADVWRERDAEYPRGYALEPDEVAQVIAFLCSRESGGISGETVTVAPGASW